MNACAIAAGTSNVEALKKQYLGHSSPRAARNALRALLLSSATDFSDAPQLDRDLRLLRESSSAYDVEAQCEAELERFSDLVLLDADGNELEPVSKSSGSFNDFERYASSDTPTRGAQTRAAPKRDRSDAGDDMADMPMLAVRRPRHAVLLDAVRKGHFSPAELQERMAGELRIWSQFARADLAPRIFGVRKYAVEVEDAAGRYEEIELITTLPERFEMSLTQFLQSKIPARECCQQLESLCLGAAALGYCHMDIKFGNVVVDPHPLRLRLIDFDPVYVRDIHDDEPLGTKLLGFGDPCDVLRQLYAALMLLLLAEWPGQLKECLLLALAKIRGPLQQVMLALAQSPLALLVANRFFHYNLDASKAAVQANDAAHRATLDFAQDRTNAKKRKRDEAIAALLVPRIAQRLGDVTSFSKRVGDAQHEFKRPCATKRLPDHAHPELSASRLALSNLRLGKKR
jgi:hypothetical protein